MRQRQRTRRVRRTRRTRRSRGGENVNHIASCKNVNRFKKVQNNGNKNYFWPDDDGCDNPAEIITVKKDEIFDRFGTAGGYFVSPIDKETYSYVSRALPYIRLENNSKKNCGNVYQNETTRTKNYHVYIAKTDIPGVKKCTAAEFYNKPGQAIQWKFPKRIFQMIADGEIEEISYTSLPKFM